MSCRITIRPEAEAEMAYAFNWYEERVPGLGSEFLLCLEAVFNAIARAPKQYQFVHQEVRRALARRFPYKIYFVEGNSEVVVLSVFHASRRPKYR